MKRHHDQGRAKGWASGRLARLGRREGRQDQRYQPEREHGNAYGNGRKLCAGLGSHGGRGDAARWGERWDHTH